MSVPHTYSRCAFAWHLVDFISYRQLPAALPILSSYTTSPLYLMLKYHCML